ncbi:MAG TPA: DPP IV N-terminal domain-containing protein [Phycisphaeraceae bacterium]
MKWSNMPGVAVFAVTLTTAGCSQFYNGGLGLRHEERQMVTAYHQAQQQPNQQPGQAQQAEAVPLDPVEPVQVRTPDQQQVDFQSPDPLAADASAQAQAAGHAAAPGSSMVGPLALYGQVEPRLVPRSSPLDGPENLRRITFAPEGADFDPALDPTGKLLAFASTRHRLTSDIYLKRVGGTTITQLTNDSANDVMPAFSPDGSRIAFASDRAGNWDIYLMDIRGGQPIQLTSDPSQDLHPSFSPDGRRLVYCSYGGASGQWEMVVINLDEPGSKRFIGHGLFPTWSPVEDKILFQRARQRGTRWFSIWTVELVNGEAMPPTEIAASSNAAVITPEWGPNGQQIVFCTVINPGTDEQERPRQADVWVVNADGSGRACLTGGRFVNLQPTWAKDGTVYFVSNRSPQGQESIWAVRPDPVGQLAQPSPETVGEPAAMVPTP